MAERSNGGMSLPHPGGPQRQPLPPGSERDQREAHSRSPRGNSGSYQYPPPLSGPPRQPFPPGFDREERDPRDQREGHPRSPRGNPGAYQYPPPSSEYDDRRPPPPSMAQPPVTLPPINVPPINGFYQQQQPYPPPGPGHPGPVDPRLAPNSYASSPTAANGHGPPPQGAPYPHYHGPPPGGPHGAPPYGAPPPPQRAYGDPYAQQPPPTYAAPGYYNQQYPGPPYGEYVQGGPQQQIAPRQRTSIACRYCRKRKIRCSGYQTTVNGKCSNCDKLKIDCIFQPVSSGVPQAFIPVSAIPGGVPPGTQLYGAYGQPLQSPTPAGPGQAQNGYHHPQGYQHQQQQPPLASPTGHYAPQSDGPPHGRRRPRESDEEDRNARLPPPPPPDGYHQSYDHRRRSPVSTNSNTPPAYQHYQHSTHSFEPDRTPDGNSPGHSPTTSTMSTGLHSPTSTTGQRPLNSAGLAPPHGSSQMAPNHARSPGPHAHKGRPSPTGNGLPAPHANRNSTEGASSSSIMSLGNLVQGPPPSKPFRGTDIDGSMLGKLNRRQ